MRAFWERAKLWLAARFFIVTVILWINVFRRRMSHNAGCGGRGKLRIVQDQKFPVSDFFEPGREFPCRIRHGAAGYLDEAMGQVRSGSLKFADTPFKSPLDLQMNTGRHCFFWNASSFLEFVGTRIKESMFRSTDNLIHYRAYHRKYGDGRKSAADAQFRTPASNATMYYHSQTPFDWRAKDGVPRYVRFRLIPGDRAPEFDPFPPNPAWVKQVAADVKLAETAADQHAAQGEPRPVDYLREEWYARLKAGPVRHVLQIQWHDVKPDDPDVIRNPLEPWDEATHPWVDLAEVEITEPLSYAEQDYMAFEVTNLPPCMKLLPAKSMQDYNSLNYMRQFAVYSIRARWFFTWLMGRPKETRAADRAKVRNRRPWGI
jgi:arachidonate 5-lipoxygenase